MTEKRFTAYPPIAAMLREEGHERQQQPGHLSKSNTAGARFGEESPRVMTLSPHYA